MDRRRFLAGAAALAAGPALAEESPLRAAAREGWLYGLPLIEMAGVRARATEPVGSFLHARALAGPASRNVTTPNNDTLYSTAWLDLSAGPARIVIPATGQRYFSLALMDMYSNNFAVLGARTVGPEGGEFTVVGPTASAPAGAIRSPTPWVWALGRTLVDGPQDLAAAHKVQDGLKLEGARSAKPAPVAGRAAPWPQYLRDVQRLLQENPPPATDAAVLQRLKPLRRLGFSTAEQAEVAAGVQEARAMLLDLRRQQRAVDGWTYPPADLGNFGQNYLLRAGTALAGLAALPPSEAAYLRALAPDGRAVFDGPGAWRLSLAGPLPCDSFWSLTMYEATAEGQLFLTANPIARYAIGDRTPGLRTGPGGGLEIVISREDPGGERTANWLPAPKAGPFAMVMRAYLPRPELLDGRFRLAPMQPI